MGFKHLVHLISFTWVALRVCMSASDWYLISHSRGPWGQVTLLNRHLPQKCKSAPSSPSLYHLDLEAAPLWSVCAGVQGDYREWSKFYLDVLQQLGDQLLVTFHPSFLPLIPPSFPLSVSKRGAGHDLEALQPPHWQWQSRGWQSGAATPPCCPKISPTAMGPHSSVLTFYTRHCPRTNQLLHPLLPYLCVVQAAFIFLPFFFFF